jgi:hypothetical protein
MPGTPLRGKYTVSHCNLPTWEKLLAATEKPAGGKNATFALATDRKS